MRDVITHRDVQVDPNEFVMVLLLKETYARLSRVASKKNTTVPHVIAEALARFLHEEE